MTLRRIQTLDGARGLAALLVALDHFVIEVIKAPPAGAAHYFAAFLGSFAVGLFFLVSGFVVASSAAASGTAEFFFRRIFRLYPVAIFAACLRYFVELIFGNQRGLTIENLELTSSLLGAYFVPNDQLVEAIFWTLTIEVTFYVIVGLSYLMVRRFIMSPYSICLYLLLALVAGGIHILPYHPEYQWATFFAVLASTIPMLVLGWLAWLRKAGEISVSSFFIGLLAVVTVLGVAPFPIYVSVNLGAPSWILAFFVFGLLVFRPKATLFLQGKKFQFLGAISYPLYACHMAVAVFVYNFMYEYNYFKRLFVFLLASFAVAYFVHVKIERPAIRMSNAFGRFLGRRMLS